MMIHSEDITNVLIFDDKLEGTKNTTKHMQTLFCPDTEAVESRNELFILYIISSWLGTNLFFMIMFFQHTFVV